MTQRPKIVLLLRDSKVEVISNPDNIEIELIELGGSMRFFYQNEECFVTNINDNGSVNIRILSSGKELEGVSYRDLFPTPEY